MGHTDKLVICDSGLPLDHDKEIVDLALSTNIPRFIDTLRVILEELKVEKAIIADEMERVNPLIYKEITTLLPDIEIQKVPHEHFKELTNGTGNVTFVRTGEATPFANIILISGVTFD